MIQTIFKLRSVSFVLFSWIFIVAFLLDAINVEDLVYNNIVLHDDAEVISPPNSGSTPIPQVFLINGNSARVNSSKNFQPTLVRVIYDQDSASLSPESASENYSLDVSLQESSLAPVSHTTCSSLYLLHCSLLI